LQGDGAPATRYPTVWSWLLLLTVLDSYTRDNGAPSNDDGEFLRVTGELRRRGVLPARNLAEMTLKSSKKSFKVQLPSILEMTFEQPTISNVDLAFVQFVENLRSLVSQFETPNRHIVIIDGLDDVLIEKEVQYEAVGALVLEAARLNHLFTSSGTGTKIVLLCRTELYERLPGSNKNKVRQDAALELDWYHDPRTPSDSLLVELANRRAKLRYPTLKDVFWEFFPREVEKRHPAEFLLEHTRHIPRDFVQVLNRIQQFSTGEPLNREQILSGLRSYSMNYFLPEIRDELDGYLSREEIDMLLKAFGFMRKRDFLFSELSAACKELGVVGDSTIRRALDLLFECSGIGNVHNRPTGSAYFTFKYRNRNAVFSPMDRIILHRGLWKALNLV